VFGFGASTARTTASATVCGRDVLILLWAAATGWRLYSATRSGSVAASAALAAVSALAKMPVSTPPGTTITTRMPHGASSTRVASDSDSSAALLADIDQPAFGCPQQWQERLRDLGRAEDVDSELPLQLVGGHQLQRALDDHPGVVDHGSEAVAALPGGYLRGGGPHAFGAGDVEGDRLDLRHHVQVQTVVVHARV